MGSCVFLVGFVLGLVENDRIMFMCVAFVC